MDWDDLRFLLALQRHGSLSGASRALHVNQTTVGRRLGALEATLGARLFERQATGHRLTEAGLRACAIGETMEAAALALDRELGGRDAGIEGLVKITAPGGFVPFVAGALAGLQRAHSRLQVELVSDVSSLNLVQREADIALRMAHQAQPSLVARKIGAAPWGLFASEPYLRSRGLPPPDLAGHDLVGYGDAFARTPGGQWLAQHARPARVIVRTNNVVAAIECAAAGLGVVAAPCFLARREPRLQRVPKPLVVGSSPVLIVSHRDLVRVPRVRATIDALVDHIREKAAVLAGA